MFVTLACLAAVCGIHLLRVHAGDLKNTSFVKGLLLDSFGNILRMFLLTITLGFNNGFLFGWAGGNIIAMGLMLTFSQWPHDRLLLGIAAFDMVLILCR